MPSRFACFFHRDTPRMGWLREVRGRQVRLLLADGSEVRVRSHALLFRWPGFPAEPGQQAALARLRDAEARAGTQEALLERLYAALPPGVPQPFEQLAGLAGEGLADESGWAQGVLFLALLRDRRRFRLKDGAFTPLPPDTVAAQLRREEEIRTQREGQEQARAWMGDLEAGRLKAAEDEGAVAFLAQLRSMVALERRSPHWGLLARPLELHRLSPQDAQLRLAGWLRGAGAWPGWPAIWRQWAGIAEAFDPALEAEAARLAATPLATLGRTDFRGHPSYTFDSASTRDFDDAISILEQAADGLTVAIHIAEPGALLEQGDPMFQEAARRMATAYSVGEMSPMLPESLSAARCSLLGGAERETLTLVVRINEAGARLLDLARSLVRVTGNLDYEAGQRLIDEQPGSWGRLAMFCAALRDARAEKGAWISDRREVGLDISDPDRIRIREINRSGPVHQIVEELAILYNREAARLCEGENLPGIYRVQPSTASEGSAPWETGETPPAARFSTQPQPHAGLACPHYTQVTSPIRRFPDLLMQRQLASLAAGEAPALTDAARAEAWCQQADHKINAYQEAARRIANHWKQRYLAQNPDQVWEGVARLRHDTRQGRVWLNSLHLNANCHFPAGIADGDPVRVKVEQVDLDRQTVQAICLS